MMPCVSCQGRAGLVSALAACMHEAVCTKGRHQAWWDPDTSGSAPPSSDWSVPRPAVHAAAPCVSAGGHGSTGSNRSLRLCRIGQVAIQPKLTDLVSGKCRCLSRWIHLLALGLHGTHGGLACQMVAAIPLGSQHIRRRRLWHSHLARMHVSASRPPFRPISWLYLHVTQPITVQSSLESKVDRDQGQCHHC